MNYDDHLIQETERYFSEDPNYYTEYTLEIWDDHSYIVYAENLTEEELLVHLVEHKIEIYNIDREHINVCECNGLNVQITPHSEFQDPTDI